MLRRGARRHTAGMEQHIEQTAPAPALRVFLVEDSAPIRERLQEMIAGAGAATVGHASGVAAAIQGVLQLQPELVILDVQLEDGTGFDVLRAVRARAPGIDIYLFSNFAAFPYRDLAARLGAKGFFDKSREFGLMRDAVARRAATAQAH